MKACSIDEIGAFWTDEQLITFLESIIENGHLGASLPCNVVANNPYPHHPSNLPEGIWFVVQSEDPKKAEVGFWKAKGDPCRIYSNSLIIGWRTTLEFYEGHSPNGHRTDWIMQEYSISDIVSTKIKGGSSLCRVFCSDREGETDKPDHQQAKVDVNGQIDLVHDDDNKSIKPLKSKLHEEMERYQAMLPHLGDELQHAECFAEGDYLELGDLMNPPLSSSSSSDNSSCVTPSSDMYFDSDALLRELEDDASLTKPSTYKFSTSRPNVMVVTVAAVDEGLPITGNNKTEEPNKTEATEPAVTLESRNPDKNHIQEDAKKQQPLLASNNEGASSSRQPPRSNKRKKIYRGNSIKKFFCFLAF